MANSFCYIFLGLIWPCLLERKKFSCRNSDGAYSETTIYYNYITSKRPAKVESLSLISLSRIVTNCTRGQILFCHKGTAGIKVVRHRGFVGMKAFYFLESRFTYLSNIVLFELLEKEDVLFTNESRKIGEKKRA